MSFVSLFSYRLQQIRRRIFDSRAYLRLVEKAILLKKYKSDKPQLFILGLPRSGTTLVYQYIVHRFKVAYFTNAVGKYPLSPCLVTFLQTAVYGKYQSDFESNYGKVAGPVAPREAGSFWGRSFGFENYISFENVSTKDINMLQNTIACVQKIFGNAPFVNKNVKHMLRIDAFSRIFPNSYFLVVERNLNNCALSNIRGRYKNLKDLKEWWSVKPPNYEDLKNLPIADQIAHQLISLRIKMESDFSRLPRERILRINYEQFCNEPELLIEKLSTIFEKIEEKNPPRDSFPLSENVPQTTEEKHLLQTLKQLT